MSVHPDFEIRWATHEDEPDIRALVGSVAMPGAVSVRFAREPDYHLGTTIMGDRCDVLIAHHGANGRLVGMACRAVGRAFLNGQESRLGYIGQIRVAEGFRGTWLVQRGAHWFKQASSPELLYFGVIARDNPRARRLLTSGRLPGGVHVRHMGGLTTLAMLLRKQRRTCPPGVHLELGALETMGEIVEFLRLHGPRRQFFPAYSLKDFTGGARLRGLAPQDFFIARRGKAVAGVMAVWDQQAYKQEIVLEYGSTLRRLRPVYDMGARFLGFSPLTPPGQSMPLAFAACVCVANDDTKVMRALLSAGAQSAWERGKSYLMLGLADNDPLLRAARGIWHVTYRSDLYAASWSIEPISALDGRIPYIEIATL